MSELHDGPAYKWDPLFSEAYAFLKQGKSPGANMEELANKTDTSFSFSVKSLQSRLFDIDASLKVWSAADVLEKHLKRNVQGFTMRRILRQILWKDILVSVVLYAMHTIFSIGMPVVAYFLLKWMEQEDPPQWQGFLLAALLGLCNVSSSLAKEYFVDRCNVMGLWTVAALSGVTYRKCLRLPLTDAFSGYVGKIAELCSSSSDMILSYWSAVLTLCLQPVEILSLVATLYIFVEWASVGGIAVVVLSIFFSSLASKKLEKVSVMRANAAEEHSQLVNECVSAMKAIKFNAWESRFERKLIDSKLHELQLWAHMGRWIALVNVSSNPAVDVISLAIVALYTAAAGNPLTPAVLAAYWVLLALLHGKIFHFPESVRTWAQGSAALMRFETFFDIEEFATSKDGRGSNEQRKNKQEEEEEEEEEEDVEDFLREGIWMEDVDLAWDVNPEREDEDGTTSRQAAREVTTTARQDPTSPSSQLRGGKETNSPPLPPLLEGMTVRIDSGSLVGIEGKVGSGKTSLLLALMGEISPARGTMRSLRRLPVAVAWVPQNPWIFNASLRENILLGRRWEEERYRQVCEACALSEDLVLLPKGDLTRIGERGVNLSGGQKQRLSLARAAYGNSPFVLLDDPLAALDMKVRLHVWKHCICGIMKDSTRLIVSHDEFVLKDCHKLLHLEQGRLTVSGDYYSLHKQNSVGAMEKSAGEDKEFDAIEMNIIDPCVEETFDDDEDVPEGILTFIKNFARGVGGYWYAFLAVSIIAFEGGMVELGVYILAGWADEGLKNPEKSTSQIGYYLPFYAACVIAELFACAVRNFVYIYGTSRAVAHQHRELVESVLGSPVAHLDQIESGKVVNLFAQSLAQLDLSVLMASDFFLYGFCYGIAIAVLCCFYVYWLVVVALITLFLINNVSNTFKSCKGLKTLHEKIRPSILAHFSTTLEGLPSIRAYRHQKIMLKEFEKRFDAHTQIALMSCKTDSWLMVMTMLLSVLFYTVTAVGIVLHTAKHGLASNAFAVSPANSAFMILNLCFGSFCVHAFVLRKLDLQDLARVRESLLRYCRKTPRENLGRTDFEDQLDPEWPRSGAVEFRQVVMRYPSQSSPAINGLSLFVAAGEKMGIVGRTGAGKSSVVTALLRLVDCEQGSITIDNVDIGKLGLTTLRSSISIVSQDPIIFSGSLRKNLDPHNEHDSDSHLWNILQLTGLKEKVESLGGLEAEVADLGENLSHGQRQLICIARALLRDRKILVLDEATSSLDLESEMRVIKEIAKSASQATVIQVAHRLQALVGSSKVLVMDKGRAIEYGTPRELLGDTNTVFAEMVNSLDSEASELLRRKLCLE